MRDYSVHVYALLRDLYRIDRPQVVDFTGHVMAPTSRWTLADAEQRLAPAVIECARDQQLGEGAGVSDRLVSRPQLG